MQASRILGAAAVAAALALVPTAAADAAGATSSSPKPWTVTLPEKAGVAGLAADGNHAYTIWSDVSPGHVAAFSRLDGALRWRKQAPAFVDDLAVGRGLVWTTDGGTLEAQRASDGSKVRSVTAPANEGFQTIAAIGTTVVGLSNGPNRQILSEYNTAGKLLGRHTTSLPATSFCHETLGGADLYAVCVGGAEQWTLYRVSVATGKTLASRDLPAGTDGGQDLVEAGGYVYVTESTGSGGSNTTPGRIVQYQAATLAFRSQSRAMDLISIAGSGRSVAGLLVTAKQVPTAVSVFSAATMTRTKTVAVHTQGTLIDFAADATNAFVVIYPPVKTQVAEDLMGIPLG